MATKPQRHYGLLISEHLAHGTQYLTATVICRENDAESPINPRSEGEDSIWDAPKHMDGVALAGFGIHGFISDRGDHPFYLSIDFRDVHSVDSRLVARMAKTFAKVERERAKEPASEAGDLFMMLGRALRLEFAVWCTGERQGAGNFGYSRDGWCFTTLADGRDHFRRLIEKHRAAANGVSVQA